MDKESGKIQTFTDIVAWQEGHKLVLAIYQLTRLFPKEELFGLISQMRRCAVSITSNIAEGFSRQSFKEKIQFYCISQGSLMELQNQILISRDINLIPKERFSECIDQSVRVHKLVNGLIKGAKKFCA